MFHSIVMPNFLYGLRVYGASSSYLNNKQNVLDRRNERRYISRKLNIRELLERLDCRKAMRTNSPDLCKNLTRKEFHE